MSRPTIAERLRIARLTSNLRMDPNRRTDWDFIVASGIARRQFANLHFDASRAELRQALESAAALCQKLSDKRRWRLTQDEIKSVAKHALVHHLAPACGACYGRGYEVQPGSPSLSARACGACKGTGRRPIQKRHRLEISQLISTIEAIDSHAEAAIARMVR